MITAMRSFAKTKAALVLFGVLIVALGIGVGMSNPFGGISGGGFIAAGDRKIGAVEVDRLVEMKLRALRQESGEFLTPQDAAERGITNEAIAELRQQTVLMAYADRIGVRASSSAVTDVLSDAPAFRDALGRFNIEAVRNYASEQRFRSVREFEDDLRNQITLDYLVRAAFSGIETPAILVEPFIAYAGERRTVSVARLTPATIPPPADPTEEDLTAFYEERRDIFAIPELRRYTVLAYSPADYLHKVDTNDDLVRSEYERRIREYSTPETRSIVEFSSSSRNAIQAVVDALAAGQTVDQIRSAATDVTFESRDVQPADISDEQYNQLVFAVPANQAAGPFELEGEWRGLIVEAITPGVATPFEQVADQVRMQMAQQEAERLYRDSYEQFFDLIAGGAALEDIAREIGAPLIELPPVDARGMAESGVRPRLVSRYPQIQQTMFNLTVGDMSDVAEGENERVVMRLEEIIPARTQTIDEVRDELEEIYTIVKMQEAASEAANNLVTAVRESGNFEQTASAARMAHTRVPDVTRGAGGMFDPAVLNGLFSIPVGETEAIQDSRGEPWVIRVESSAPIAEEAREALTEQARAQLASSIGGDLENVFLRSVFAAVTERTDERAIQRYLDRFRSTDQ